MINSRNIAFNNMRVSIKYQQGLVATLLLALPLYATADQDDTFNLVGGLTARYESNLFRLSDSANLDNVPNRPSKSDWLYSASAGVRIDKPYAQQRFQFDLTGTENRFSNNSFLNYNGVDYKAAWLWHLTPRISGILLANQEQRLVNFVDFQEAALDNIQTNQVRLFNADADIGAGVHLIGGVMEVRSRNSQTFDALGDYVQRGGEAGVKYVSRADSSISLVQRRLNGEYRDRILDPVAQLDTGFIHQETEAQLDWKLSAKSTVLGKLGYLDREHDNFKQRDYSGTFGRLEYRWATTAKLQWNTAIARNLVSFQEAANSYYIAESFSIGPIWKISPKTSLRGRFDYSERDFRGAIEPTSPLRKDTIQSFALIGDWQATRNILISGVLQHDKRNSNFEQFDFDATAVGLSANMQF